MPSKNDSILKLPLQSLVTDLMSTDSFEQGAQTVLMALTTWLEAGSAANVVGGVLQIQINGREHTTHTACSLAVSATARLAVAKEQAAVLIDIGRRQARVWASGCLQSEQPLETSGFYSRSDLDAHIASHLLAIPLRIARGQIEGVVVLHLRSVGYQAVEFMLVRLQTMADVASAILPRLPTETPKVPDPGSIPIVGAAMRALLTTLEPFATIADPLLLFGEEGVGKSFVARWVHDRENRHLKFTRSRVETGAWGDQLFGWRGDLGNRPNDRRGLLEESGTVFVDQVLRLSKYNQQRLLDALETGRFKRGGESTSRAMRCRVILGATRPADLAQGIADGTFDRELAERIGWATFTIPPLRERRDEIVLWSVRLLTRHDQKAVLSPPARVVLENASWLDGNLKQLEQTIHRAHQIAMMSAKKEGPLVIEERHVIQAIRMSPRGPSLIDLMNTAAERYVDEAEIEETVTLKLARAFEGMVVEVAVRRHKKRAALMVLGRSKLVADDNHHRLIKDAKRSVQRLREVFGEVHIDTD